MKKFFYIAIMAFFLLHDFSLFAQAGPGDDDGGGGLEGGDPPAAPINSKLIYLTIAGIIFAFYSYKKNRKLIK
jgi:hypothetical protein